MESKLRIFLKENRVTLELSSRIKTFMQAKFDHAGRLIHEQDLPFLSQLPTSLSAELRLAIYYPKTSEHTLFVCLCRTHSQLFSKISLNAMKQQFWIPEQDVFAFGGIADAMIFVV